MARLTAFTLQSPGTLGLNTQDADDVQDPRYSTVADNCIISKNGLLEVRKGFKRLNAVAATGTPTLDTVFSYVQDDGTEIIVSAGGNKLWSGDTTLTDETGALTVTSDNWQFQNYAGEVFGYNGADAPVYWDGVAATFATIASKVGSAGIVNSGVQLSAYGRSWVVDTTTVSQINYSDLLVPHDFTNGSAGTIDLNTVWPYSNDTITALAAHNNNLIIFCEKSIVIYGNAHNINNLYLVEVIRDIGCIARDGVQNIGDDIFFLSKDGVRSLGRTIIQDNMPQRELSNPIRDDMIDSIANETMALVRSTYNEKEGFYLINFPSVPVTWVCDVRLADKGVSRWTKWDSQVYGLATGSDNTLYGGLAGGYLSSYDGYYDTDTTDGSVDQAYVMKYRSGWIDPGLNAIKAIFKRAVFYIRTTINNPFTAVWSYDFCEESCSETKNMTADGAAVYGTATYGTAVYGGGTSRQETSIQMRKTGSVVKIGFQAASKDGEFGFNRIIMFLKSGRIK